MAVKGKIPRDGVGVSVRYRTLMDRDVIRASNNVKGHVSRRRRVVTISSVISIRIFPLVISSDLFSSARFLFHNPIPAFK